MASLWTYEAVYFFLKSRSNSEEKKDALKTFLAANLTDLQSCCKSICDQTVLGAVRFEEDRKGNEVHKKANESTKAKIEQLKKQTETKINGSSVKVSTEATKDAELVLNHLNVSWEEALRVVLSFSFGDTDDTKRVRLYANRILSERRFKVMVVATLFHMTSPRVESDHLLDKIPLEYAKKIHTKGFSSHVVKETVFNAHLSSYCRREKDPLIAGRKYEGNSEILGLLKDEVSIISWRKPEQEQETNPVA